MPFRLPESMPEQGSSRVTHLHRDINRRIVDANSVVKVLNIVEANSQDFNAVNISTAFHRLARMWRDLPDNNNGSSNGSSSGQTRLDTTLHKLMQLAVRRIKEVQGQGLGIIIWALAKICYDPVRIRSLLQAFAQEAIDRLTDGVPKNEPNLKLGPQSLSNMVYAYAVMGYHPGEDLLAAIAQGAHSQLTDFSPQGLSNLVWAYAKLGALPTSSTRAGQEESAGLELMAKGNLSSLLDALALEAVNQLMDTRSSNKFIPQNLSNMVYGSENLGRLFPSEADAVGRGKDRPRLRLAAAGRSLHLSTKSASKGDERPKFSDFNATRYAMLGHEPGPMLLLAVARQALLQLDSFSPQELTNMVWAFAKLLPPGQPLFGPPQALLNAVPKHVVRQLADDSQHHKVKPQTVSNLLWAYATLGWAPTHLLTSLAIETLRQLPYFKPQELANTLWSYATLGYTPMPEWLGQMGVACEGQIGGCKPQELSSLVWALASLRFHPGATCLYTATETANRVLDKFKPGEVCNLVWGLAHLGCQPGADLLQQVVQASQDWSEGVGPVEVSRLLWGLAVLDHLPKTAAVSLYTKLGTLPLALLTAESLDQILQVDAFLECSVGSLMHLFPDQLQHALQLTFINNMQQHQPSQMAKEISEGLSALQIPHSGPYLMEHGPVLVDIALLGPCPAIALQVEDPGQLAVNAPWLPLGATRLKQQTLRSNGWQVVSIPFHIWSMLGTLPLRAAYLQQLLHICQAAHLQPSSRTPLSHAKSNPQQLTSLTYSNASIEAINSALAAQCINSACHRGAIMPAVTAAACTAAPACDQAEKSAAAEAASQQGALQRRAEALERSTSGISQQSRNTSLYSVYDRRLLSMPVATTRLMQSASHQGLTHMSQTQSGQGFTQVHGQGGMQCNGLQGLREAEATALRQTRDAPQSLTTSPWGCSAAGGQGQGSLEQGQQSQLSSEGWAGQGTAELGQATQQGQEGWAGQPQTRAQDDPLNAAEYEAVMRLQSLALQLQRTGLQQHQTQEQTDNNHTERFPSVLHYDESAADSTGFVQNYSRSCQSPTYGRSELGPFSSSPSKTAGPSHCDSSDTFGHAWRPPLSSTLPAHRLPWSSAMLQQSNTPSQGTPCVVLQAAGYAPRFPQQQDIH